MSFHIPENFNPSEIDPALLTFKEWLQIVDPKRKDHPSSAYNRNAHELSTNSLTNELYSKDEWPRLLRTIKRHGLTFEIRLGLENLSGRYHKRDPDGYFLRDANDELIPYTDEECKQLGLHLVRWELAVFHDDQRIGAVQDEWGCMLVMVAKEYRSFGLGAMLLKIAYTIQPDKPSGGFTEAGMQTFARIHAEFVQEALQSGLYTRLVRDRQITVARVKAIIASARSKAPSNQAEVNLDSSNPKDWLLYVGEYGEFIIYDRKLRDMLGDGEERYEYFVDRMIKGMIYIISHEHYAHVHVFGADTLKLKQFLMSCGLEYSLRETLPLYVEGDDATFVLPDMATLEAPSNKIGFRSQKVVPTGKRLEYDDLGLMERQWRKTFDRYDEFKIRMMELGFSKFSNH